MDQWKVEVRQRGRQFEVTLRTDRDGQKETRTAYVDSASNAAKAIAEMLAGPKEEKAKK